MICDKKELEKIFESVRRTERDNLQKLPADTAIRVQSGWLLGYADCWNKLHKAIVGK
jgi:hypothetical protein